MWYAAAQLSLGYLAGEVREPVRGSASSLLFDTQDTNLVHKINQNPCINNLVDGPLAIDARRDQLVLSLEALGAHCVQEAFKFSFV